MTGVLYTARISTIEVIVSSDKLISGGHKSFVLGKMTLLSMGYRISVCRPPARCSGGHGFNSCRDSDFFFVPRLCHVDLSQVICLVFHSVVYISTLNPQGGANAFSSGHTIPISLNKRFLELTCLALAHVGHYLMYLFSTLLKAFRFN